MDLAAYRAEAEEFSSALDREYYLHFSGQRDEYDIQPVYERHAGLFSREAVDDLRTAGSPELLEFAVHGLIGRATDAETAELARREAKLEIEVDGERMPYRQAAVTQANEPDRARRSEIEAARHEALRRELDPLLRELLERSHALAGELGWPSMVALCEELSGMDLRGLARQTGAFLDDTDDRYEPLVEPEVEAHLGLTFDSLRRSDLPAFFRAPTLDRHFPADGLVASLEQTLGGMGIDLRSQPGVTLDTEQRPRKSPRAFCAPVRVPDEVYLVIARIGGRDDYSALFHEAGHTEHYAHMHAELPVEHRFFGDNSLTESFAFLFEHLVSDPRWLERRLGIGDPEPVTTHARAVLLVYLRRYCAKLAYELELQDAPQSLDPLRERYAAHLSRATHVDWPADTWLADVDPFFYAARYLRAWAAEARLRRTLLDRFGETWFEQPEAGELLRDMWRRGQRTPADELLEELAGGELDFALLAAGAS